MDTETIITLLIIFGTFLWNIIAKLREKSEAGSPLPWPGQEEEELLPEDLLEEKTPQFLREKRMGPAKPMVAPPGSPGTESLAGRPLTAAVPPAMGTPGGRSARPPSAKKLRRAVVWAEVLQPPIALRERD